MSVNSQLSTESWASVYRALKALVTAQQIGEPQRGWAWTRALQGVPANEIHLCGDGSALPLIKRLAADMNEPLKVALFLFNKSLPFAGLEPATKGGLHAARQTAKTSCHCPVIVCPVTVFKPRPVWTSICALMQVHEYSRFTPLVVESGGLERGYLDVQPGDCVVAFSRKDIYDIKQLIEAGTGQRWALPRAGCLL